MLVLQLSLFVQEGEFWWVSGGTSEDGVTDLSTSQVNLLQDQDQDGVSGVRLLKNGMD